MKKSIIITSLVFIEQIIKVVIKKFFMGEVHISRLKIGFKPFLNKNQLTIFNNELNMKLSLEILTIINLVIIAAIIMLFFYHKKTPDCKKIYCLNGMFYFLMSGTICSCIDKIFWKGSLDYIMAFGKISDLKDVYLVVGAVFYIVFLLCNMDTPKKKSNAV